MPSQLYTRVERLNKAILRATRSLHRKGVVYLEEIYPTPYSTGTKAIAVLLRLKGLEAAQRYAMPRPDAKPDELPFIPIITDASPEIIHTYDEEGKPKGVHELHPITIEEYLKKHTSSTP